MTSQRLWFPTLIVGLCVLTYTARGDDGVTAVDTTSAAMSLAWKQPFTLYDIKETPVSDIFRFAVPGQLNPVVTFFGYPGPAACKKLREDNPSQLESWYLEYLFFAEMTEQPGEFSARSLIKPDDLSTVKLARAICGDLAQQDLGSDWCLVTKRPILGIDPSHGFWANTAELPFLPILGWVLVGAKDGDRWVMKNLSWSGNPVRPTEGDMVRAERSIDFALEPTLGRRDVFVGRARAGDEFQVQGLTENSNGQIWARVMGRPRPPHVAWVRGRTGGASGGACVALEPRRRRTSGTARRGRLRGRFWALPGTGAESGVARALRAERSPLEVQFSLGRGARSWHRPRATPTRGVQLVDVGPSGDAMCWLEPRSLKFSATLRYLSPSPRPTTHLRAMRSTEPSSVRALSPTAGTHARACDSSLTLNRSCSGLNEEAYVEVQVGRLAVTGRNPVHVDVEDGVVERPHVESGFFARLAQRDRKGIGVSVAVTPGLQPAPELGVVRKEHAVALHVHEPS